MTLEYLTTLIVTAMGEDLIIWMNAETIMFM